MVKEIRDALLELQDFHLWRGHTNKLAAVENLLNERRDPTWYDFYCVKRAVKEFIAYNTTGSTCGISHEMGVTIHRLELICEFINLYRSAELDGGYMGTFDEYFSHEVI